MERVFLFGFFGEGIRVNCLERRIIPMFSPIFPLITRSSMQSLLGGIQMKYHGNIWNRLGSASFQKNTGVCPGKDEGGCLLTAADPRKSPTSTKEQK